MIGITTFLFAAMIGFHLQGTFGMCVGAAIGWVASLFIPTRAETLAKERLDTLEAGVGNIESDLGRVASELSAIDGRLEKQQNVEFLLKTVANSMMRIELGLERAGLKLQDEPLGPPK